MKFLNCGEQMSISDLFKKKSSMPPGNSMDEWSKDALDALRAMANPESMGASLRTTYDKDRSMFEHGRDSTQEMVRNLLRYLLDERDVYFQIVRRSTAAGSHFNTQTFECHIRHRHGPAIEMQVQVPLTQELHDVLFREEPKPEPKKTEPEIPSNFMKEIEKL
jgi:hypothetical protein